MSDYIQSDVSVAKKNSAFVTSGARTKADVFTSARSLVESEEEIKLLFIAGR